MNPKAREQGLLVKELTDETVIYDRKRDKAHCLNRTAALIWRHCDGQTSVEQLVTLLRKQDLPADEAVVWLALDRLAKARLLEESWMPQAQAAGVTRRQVMRVLKCAGGLTLLLPAVTSIVAASPVQQQSFISVSNPNCGTANDAGDCVVTTACPTGMSCTGITSLRVCYCLKD